VFYFVNCLNIILTWLLPLETLLLHSMPVILFCFLLHGTFICLVGNCVLHFVLLLLKDVSFWSSWVCFCGAGAAVSYAGSCRWWEVVWLVFPQKNRAIGAEVLACLFPCILVFYYQLDSETKDACIVVINTERGRKFIKKGYNSFLASRFLNANS